MFKVSLTSIVRKAKRRMKALVGRDLFLTCQAEYNTIYLGSDYGGWVICPDKINSDSIIYSFGVGDDISFDTALIEIFGVVVDAFDPTPRSIEWINHQNVSSLFRFHNYGLSNFDGEVIFHPPVHPSHMSFTLLEQSSSQVEGVKAPVFTLSSIMSMLNHTHIDVLKMDIEGAEYRVIDYLTNTEIRPLQILIEFHHRFPEVGVMKTRQAIKKLNDIGYLLFSISENGEEMSFIKGN